MEKGQMKSFQEQFNEYIRLIEGSLPGFLPQGEVAEKAVNEAMAYSLLSGGKRIRGVLVLAFYRLFAEDVRPALPFAAAVEMVHAYSLIHDDLPCMDDDDMRRGKPSCHIAYGEAVALLAGDGLLTLAFETMARAENGACFTAGQILAAVRCLAAAAGTAGMIGGQVIDLAHEDRLITPALLEEMDNKKTGALIAAAAVLGCILGGAEERSECAREYARCIGLAFQVVDDTLDCTADEKALGKPVGSDAGNKKSTYVSLYGLERAREIARELTGQAIRALDGIEGDAWFLRELAVMLSERKN